MRKRTLTTLLILFSAMALLTQNNESSKADKQLYDRLYSMAAKGQLDSLKQIFDTEKIDLKKYENENFTPILYAAVRSKNKEVVEYLVSKGAKIESITSDSLFNWLMENSPKEMVEYFISMGVKIEKPKKTKSWTPLAASLDNSDFAIARELLKQTKDYTFRGRPLLVFFADGMPNSPEVVVFLIKEGINKEYYNEALTLSVYHNDAVSAALLLDAGADVNIRGVDSTSLLLRTLNYNVMRLLVDRGINLQDKKMLDNAWRNPMLLKVLQERGILPDLSQKGMNDALIRAAQDGDEWTVDYLLSRGVEVNYRYKFPNLKYIYNDEDLTYTTIEVPEEDVHIDINIEDEAHENNTYNNLSSDQERESYEIDRANKKLDIDGQTALIKNAIYGYQGCNYGNYRDEKNEIQVSPTIAHKLLDAGADPNIRDLNGLTALHYTAINQACRMMIWPIPMGNRQDREAGFHGDPSAPPQQHHDSIALALIAHKANLNDKDADGNTPLILAAMSGNNSMLKILLKAGAKPHIKNKYGKAFYNYTTNQEAFEIIKEAGLSPSLFKDRLNKAFSDYFERYRPRGEYDADELKKLLALGADPNTHLYGDEDWNGLRYAFERMYSDQNQLEIAQALIDRGINLNTENRDGNSLLITLIKEDKLNDNYNLEKGYYVLDFLVKNNIDLNYKTARGRTALSVARLEEKDEVTKLLEKYGAKRDLAAEWWYLLTEKNWQDTALDDLRQLIKEGIDVNMRSQEAVSYYIPTVNQKGVTALMLAATYGKANILTELLKLGADVNIKAADGKTTALSIAKDRRNQEIIDLLTKAGAKE